MRVLLCGEGRQEVGVPRVWDDRTRGFINLEGWMQALGRRLISGPVEFELRVRSQLFLEGRRERALGRRPPGHGRKSKLARWIAANEEFDAVIFMVDADTPNRRRWRELMDEIRSGFEALPFGPPGVSCVPMSASESWLLADRAAWAALGQIASTALPARPEHIWGSRNDPNSDHPHQFFRRVCDQAGIPDSRDTRLRIAQISDVATIRHRCPISFPPFELDLSAL